LEQVACNLCGSAQLTSVYEMPDTRFFPNEVFTVVECNHCGLGFVNPRPTLAEMAKYYPRDYYQAQPSEQPGEPPAFVMKRNQGKLRFLQEVERRRGPKKLLDVGAGNGDFARFMLRRGWQVEAVEISEHAARIHEFPVYPEEFQNISISVPTYDAITIWAVLEHVHDPMAYFRKAAQVLQPNGRLVFLVTNFHSMASRYLFGEDIPRHLYFFTRETVAQYLQKNGLYVESEDNGRSIYKMAPAHWLSYLIQTRLRGRPFTFADVPLSSREFRRVHGLSKGLGTSLKYLAYSPSSVVERMLFPAVESVQILRKTYGISTYVARKA
jgi:2-polyprenyl-3-methyl-5-hydroxy-6-metoxy-1,4-benzoquinol methylase